MNTACFLPSVESGAKCLRVKGHAVEKRGEARETKKEGDRWPGLEGFMHVYANVTVKGSLWESTKWADLKRLEFSMAFIAHKIRLVTATSNSSKLKAPSS